MLRWGGKPPHLPIRKFFMIYQDFSSYYQMSLDGWVDPWRCIDQSHEMFLIPDYNNETRDIEIKCIFPECTFKIIPGYNFYKDMVEKINSALTYINQQEQEQWQNQ